MHIYRCTLTLMEKMFFSSREVSNCYYTEPLVGNYALAYAMGFCQAPYSNQGEIHYEAHLSALNERGLYVTPATVLGEPTFHVEQFNAQPETYWSAMGAGVLVTRPDGARMEQSGKVWYVHPSGGGRRKKVNPANRPQFGRVRCLAAENVAQAYVLSREPIAIPSYIRLGKFMSKARVAAAELTHEEAEAEERTVPQLLNPADLPADATLHLYDLVAVPPTPLVRNALLSGRFYRASDGCWLPAGMRFGLPA
jgi:CRISPR-associated protein Csc1